MKIEQGTIVEILPTEIWYEKDIMGTVHVKMQHQGMEPFTFIQMHYDYAYTSNSHQHDIVKRVGQLLGVEDIQSREWQMPESWKVKSDEADEEHRKEIITSMCYTQRHDYGLDKTVGTGFADIISSGMTQDEKQSLWNQMAQIFDNDIAPYMEFKK